MTYTVDVQRMESQPIAVVRRRASLQQLTTVVPQACGIVWNFVKALQIPAGRNVAVYLDDEITLEVGVEVFSAFKGDGNVYRSSTPAGLTLTTVHWGPYDQLAAAHEAIRDWANPKYALAGPNWEVYGHWSDDPSQQRTDVYYLVKAS